MKKANLFKIGDVVKLKSGGPKMTVTSVPDASPYNSREEYFVKWFAGAKGESGHYPEDALEMATSESKMSGE